MAVGAYAAKEKVDAAIGFDFCFISGTFCSGVFSVAIENVDVFCRNIDVVKEILVHEGMIALLMVAGNAYIFVHVECHYILERYFALLVEFYQTAVHAQR